ncbi:MAG: hypothetical protein KDA44_21940 [Planctomycetales bacterium]|nr:hypothetical protein [Planctomycetales bacterium]
MPTTYDDLATGALLDWSDCQAATPQMSVEAMLRLIQTAPPGPWPHGWASWDNTIEAHRRLVLEFIADLEDPHVRYPQQRGIVIAGGGLKYFPSVWVNVNLLRHFGCQLPIQLWYMGDGECDPYLKRLLAPLGVECIDARKLEPQYPARILCGWELKPYAALHAPFAEVLFLDADNGVCHDPTYLFDDPEYQRTGAVYWPDYANWTLKWDIWEIFGIDWLAKPAAAGAERAFESGQYLIDKRRCWRELRLALWYGEHSDFVFQHVYGDKECFHLAWRKLGTEYAMPGAGPGWDVHTITQYDFQGRIVFQHRCQDKWRFAGNRFNDSLRNEQLCFDLVRDLATKWDGTLWNNPAPTPAEQRVIDSIAGQRYVYRRVGYDERTFVLNADSYVGDGAAECERRWSINRDEDVDVLTLSRLDRPTCNLRQGPDGTWRGAWLEHERMPVELFPASSSQGGSR